MKNTIKMLGIIALVAVIGFSFTACDNGGGGTGGSGSVLAAELARLLNPDNVQNGQTYTITITADEAIATQFLNYTDKSNITIVIKGSGAVRTISLTAIPPTDYDNLFRVGNGVKLVLDENITLQGKSSNTGPLVNVFSGGALEMRAGSKITGNPSGGVIVSSNGTFTMNGGIISMNGGPISGNTGIYSGGGVYMADGGTFTMNDGEISGNTASGGGGVYVASGETFTMNGGTISGNTARDGYGGGVYNGGTFAMSGGVISGNSSSEGGGGVFVDSSGTFRIVTGAIYGSNETNAALRNTVTGSNASGAALLIYSSSLGTGTATYGSNGTGTNLSTTNNTIKVVNGNLDNGSGPIDPGADTWSYVTTISQVNGSWKVPASYSGTTQGMTTTVNTNNYIMTFDAAAKTRTLSGSATSTISGGIVDTYWPVMKEGLEQAQASGQMDGVTYTFNDANHSYTVTYNNFTQTLTDAQLTQMRHQINQNGSKLKITEGGVEVILTKME